MPGRLHRRLTAEHPRLLGEASHEWYGVPLAGEPVAGPSRARTPPGRSAPPTSVESGELIPESADEPRVHTIVSDRLATRRMPSGCGANRQDDKTETGKTEERWP